MQTLSTNLNVKLRNLQPKCSIEMEYRALKQFPYNYQYIYYLKFLFITSLKYFLISLLLFF